MNACPACGAAVPPGARFCPACAAPVQAPPEQRERKLATVLFADLAGSTELGASEEPERMRALLDRFYDDAGLISQAIERFQAMGLEWHAQQTRHLGRRR
jgi:hypothetical protein